MQSISRALFFSWSMVFVALLVSCDESASRVLKQGDDFPIDELASLIQENNSKLDVQGKTLVVNFWASWCRPCRKEMPELQKLSDAVDKQRVLVIAVSVDEDKNLMQEFLLRQEIGFPNFQDPERRLAASFLGIQVYPETFIVSPQGRIVLRVKGERKWNSRAVHELLEAVENGHEPDINGLS